VGVFFYCILLDTILGDFETPVKSLLNFFTRSYQRIFPSAALCVAKATGAGKAEE